MTGVAPTPPAGSAAAAAGVTAAALRRPPEEADRAVAPDAEGSRRGPVGHPASAPPPDPEGQRGRLVDVFA